MRPALFLGKGVHAVVTTRVDGDQRADLSKRARVGDFGTPWTLVRQVHGNRVVTIEQSMGDMDEPADAIVTKVSGLAIAVLGADCSLVGLSSDEGIIAVAHAGWRGLLAGVIEATVTRMRDLGAGAISAVIGPTIGPECYEFSAVDLVPIVARYGERIHVRRIDGSDALDLAGAVELALLGTGVDVRARLGGCTACDPRFYSWRGGRDESRHALVIYRSDEAIGDARG